jgi:hypothetical protein
MSDRAVVIWFIAGVPIAIVDGWLSVQSMFGLIAPSNFLRSLVAVTMGIGLTIFAIYVPILRGSRSSPIFVMLWIGSFSIDLITSVIGVIWYGALGEPLNSNIDFSVIKFDPSNWLVTLTFIAFVLLVAGCCFKFGQALNELGQRRRDR